MKEFLNLYKNQGLFRSELYSSEINQGVPFIQWLNKKQLPMKGKQNIIFQTAQKKKIE